MNQLFLLIVGILALALGSVLGYYARQSIAKRDWRSIEARLQKKISQAKTQSEEILAGAKKEAEQTLELTKKETNQQRAELFKAERLLLKRENILEQKISAFESEKTDFQEKVRKLKGIKETLENLRATAISNLERVSGLSREEAKKELLENLEKEYQKEILERMKKLELEGRERFEKRAKEILAQAIQKWALSQAQEITTTTLTLPSEEIKGRIIGKEGRNIRALEKLTGVEIVVDETPEAVVISSFDPIRRQIAKSALEKLIQDGRIQPARIEEKVEEAKKEINSQIKEAGEAALYDVGLVGFDPKLVQLLGRLRFRTSYGQNVLLHSIEVSHLASALAAEIGANPLVCKKAGLFHDIGKAVDQQVEGSHTDIGIKILEKFGQDQEVISAMKSHHEEYPYESLEAILVQAADQISGARPGARKDTLENYLKRLADLENIASGFSGVEKAWALQAGREIRVFVKSEEIDDLEARKLAKDIANRIQEELKYPGEIKVNVIRETRVTEYAK
ncbi:ribonuclease Y [bacterium]|uniref:Ribonuclease Y n=3 Tax=Candidatus Nealsoniibacteriota TaxID=1817911 RepID=A0A2M7EB18_9BACT|nr:ribonuclease Y [bacterium]PIV64908.1 MAG: ribonuclease Y [Candidatus Nealsonbacteria bacterium CG01_land_8_20_14_3_00_12]PIW91253.1 MAG: ribonuclease Y [Candidatus Nealsonbacteria bacterium CG_4_8_14_3_um_filter_37_36]PJA82936.1 MAG: ribonuclease Y [Candidatus Nealsonbacteria bacterium CG_4_9_14_3_um_filter_37_29]